MSSASEIDYIRSKPVKYLDPSECSATFSQEGLYHGCCCYFMDYRDWCGLPQQVACEAKYSCSLACIYCFEQHCCDDCYCPCFLGHLLDIVQIGGGPGSVIMAYCCLECMRSTECLPGKDWEGEDWLSDTQQLFNALVDDKRNRLSASELEKWQDLAGKGRFARVHANFGASSHFKNYTEYEILTNVEESRQSVELIYYDGSGAKQSWPVLLRHLKLLDPHWRIQPGGPDHVSTHVDTEASDQHKVNPIFDEDAETAPAAASATASDPYAVGSWVRLRKDETKAGMKEYTAYQITKSPDHEDDMWVDLKDPDTPKGTFVNKSKVTQTTGPDGEYYHTPFGVDTFVMLKRSDTDVYMEPRIPYIVRLNESDSEYIHVGKIDGSYAGIVEKHKLRPAFPKGTFVTLKVDESNTAMERHRCYPVVTGANGPNGDLKLDLNLEYPENDTVWCASKKVKVAFEYGCKVKWAPGVEPHTANMFHNHEKLWDGDDVMQVWDDPDTSLLGGGVGIDSSTTVQLMYKGEKFEAWVKDLVNTSLD